MKHTNGCQMTRTQALVAFLCRLKSVDEHTKAHVDWICGNPVHI